MVAVNAANLSSDPRRAVTSGGKPGISDSDVLVERGRTRVATVDLLLRGFGVPVGSIDGVGCSAGLLFPGFFLHDG